MNRRSRISAFLSAHKTALSKFGGLVALVVATFLGTGALFEYEKMKAEAEKAAHERVELEAKLLDEMFEHRKAIHELVPRYVAARDRLSDKTRDVDQLAYDELSNRLTDLFTHYNSLEAKLSDIEDRDPQFMLPASLIRPRHGAKPKLQAHDVEQAVSQELALVLDQYFDGASRKAQYRRWCKAGAGHLCTRLAIRQFNAKTKSTLDPKDRKLDQEDRKLFEQGCALRDSVGCELLAYKEFHRGEYASTERWLIKACDLSSGPACGFLGSLYASRVLGKRHDPERARLHLEEGCTLRSGRGCYYLAMLYVSGLVKRNEKAAQERLYAACRLNLSQACESLDQFDEFKTCSPNAIHALEGEVKLAVQCKRREKPARSAGGPSEMGIGRALSASMCS